MTYIPPTFCSPNDGPVGTLLANHQPFDGTLVLADPAILAAVAPPVRLSVFTPDGGRRLGQYLVTALVGNTATVTPDDGFADVFLPAGSLLEVTPSANAFREIQGAIQDLAITVITNTPVDNDGCLLTAFTNGMPTITPLPGSMMFDPDTGLLWIRSFSGWISK